MGKPAHIRPFSLFFWSNTLETYPYSYQFLFTPFYTGSDTGESEKDGGHGTPTTYLPGAFRSGPAIVFLSTTTALMMTLQTYQFLYFFCCAVSERFTGYL
jgi:hypothetical protein